jgi:molybdopterin synthase catalytic subunit
MQIDILIHSRPIDLHPFSICLDGGMGALASFTGVVRPEENNQSITALEYEAYQPMAENTMRRIIEEIATRHPCQFVGVTHRIGTIPVGEAAIQMSASAAHRAEAFAMLVQFMDRLKQDVPIWKNRAHYRDPLVLQPPQ